MSRRDYYVEGYFRLDGEERTPRLKKAIRFLSENKVQRVLDIGCGDGGLALYIKEQCSLKEIFGIDVSPKAVRLAKQNGVRSFVVDVDNYKFPFPNDYFDGVFCGEIIEHLFDPDHMLKEIKRVLAPGGVCVITTPNLSSWFNRFALLFGYQPYYMDVSLDHYVGKLKTFQSHSHFGGGHIRVFTYRALKQLLQIHNFEILEASGACGYNAEDYSFVLGMIEQLMSYIPSLSSTNVFLVRKKCVAE